MSSSSPLLPPAMTLSTTSCGPSSPSTPISGTPLIDLPTAASSINLANQDSKKSPTVNHYGDFKAIDFALVHYRDRSASSSPSSSSWKPQDSPRNPANVKKPVKAGPPIGEVQQPTPQSYPDMEGFEDPAYLLAVSPKTLASTISKSPLQYPNTAYLTSGLRTKYNKAIHPNLPPALRHKGPARTNLVLAVALTMILGFCISTKASPIGAAVFSFGVFGVLGPFVG